MEDREDLRGKVAVVSNFQQAFDGFQIMMVLRERERYATCPS